MGTPKVNCNGREVVHAQSGGQLVTTDVCRTTVGSSTPAIPYVNEAKSEDADGTSSTVFVAGSPLCVLTSSFACSQGDDSGDKGGVNSGVIQGAATFIDGSPDVFADGIPVTRSLDLMVSNAQNTAPAPLLQGQGAPAVADGVDPVPSYEPRPQVIVEVGGAAEAEIPSELIADAVDAGWTRSRPLAWVPHDGKRWTADINELPKEAEHVRLSLLDRDRRHRFCKVPLTYGADHETWLRDSGDSTPDRYPTVLVPTLVRYAHDADLSHRRAGTGFGGWLYLFRNGHLWRECYVSPEGSVYEVNLAYEHGDQRRATGEGRNVLLLPLQINGEAIELEMAFSAVQWSWARVCAYGSLHPDDPRAAVHTDVDPDDSAPPREQRLQPVDLSGYPDDFPDGTGSVGSSGAFRDAEPVADEPPIVREDLLPFEDDGFAVLYLDDPLGEARRLSREHAQHVERLEAEVLSLQTGIEPEKLIDDGDLDVDESELEKAAALHDSAVMTYQLAFVHDQVGPGEESPDREFLEDLLGKATRRAFREDISGLREHRLVLLKTERYADALSDYCHNTPRRRFEALSVIADHFGDLAEPANASDLHLDGADEHDNDEAREGASLTEALNLLEAVLSGSPSDDADTERAVPERLLTVTRELTDTDLLFNSRDLGLGLPVGNDALERLIGLAPHRLRDIERAMHQGDSRSLITPENTVVTFHALIETLAAPVSYSEEVLDHVQRISMRLAGAPGMHLLQLEIAEMTFRAPSVDGVSLTDIQDAVPGRAANDPYIRVDGKRFPAFGGATDKYYAFLGAETESRLHIIGNPGHTEMRLEQTTRARQLVSTRDPGNRLSDLAARVSRGSDAGQALRGAIGMLEIVNINNALARARDGDRAYIASALASMAGLAAVAGEAVRVSIERRGLPRRGLHNSLGRAVTRATVAGYSLGGLFSLSEARSTGLRGDTGAAALYSVSAFLSLSAGILFASGVPLGSAILGIIAMGFGFAGGYLQDDSLGDFFRNGPFSTGIHERMQLDPASRGYALASALIENGPSPKRAYSDDSWRTWPDVRVWLESFLDASPLTVKPTFAVHEADSSAGAPLDSVDIAVEVPYFDWIRSDSLEMLFIHRQAGIGSSEPQALRPCSVVAAPQDERGQVKVVVTFDVKEMSGAPGDSYCFLFRHRTPKQPGIEGCDSASSVEYWCAEVSAWGDPRRNNETVYVGDVSTIRNNGSRVETG